MELDKATKYLLDWFVRYTKNRDLVFRKISEIKEEGNKAIVVQKDGKSIHYYAVPFPEDLEKIAAGMKEEHKGLIVYNTRENFEKLVKAWKKLSETKNLTIYFVNPFSKLDKKWIINPHVHHSISDSASLKQGLESMYVMVEPTTKEEVEQLTR
jgi:Lhr-like helicase